MVEPDRSPPTAESSEGNDPRLGIPEFLGKQAGEFIDASRLVRVFVPEGESVMQLGNQVSEFTSTDYTKGSRFQGSFTLWSRGPAQAEDREFQGYLAGFPRLTDREGGQVDCLHLWMNNSDVVPDTYAIPLLSISGLYIYSKMRTDLESELDELAMESTTPRWEVPLLRDRKTKEMYFRPANANDISRVIEEVNEAPILLYGGSKGKVNPYRTLLDKEDVLKLLED